MLKHSIVFYQLLPGSIIKLKVAFLEFFQRQLKKFFCISLYHDLDGPFSINGANMDNLHNSPSNAYHMC